MIVTILILIGSALLGGFATNLFTEEKNTLKLPLVFAGSYLLTITLIHMLPELFAMSVQRFKLGSLIVAGFLIQQLLEYFTSGIEHGHFHKNGRSKNKIGIILALCIHSVLEGTLLMHDSPKHFGGEYYPLLFGIVLHKAPAAFALMAVFRERTKFGIEALIVLIIFSISSPFGLFITQVMSPISHETMSVLFALVTGSFLHISTTIFVESSPEHKFGLKKLLVSIVGAGLALFSEYFL